MGLRKKPRILTVWAGTKIGGVRGDLERGRGRQAWVYAENDAFGLKVHTIFHLSAVDFLSCLAAVVEW